MTTFLQQSYPDLWYPQNIVHKLPSQFKFEIDSKLLIVAHLVSISTITLLQNMWTPKLYNLHEICGQDTFALRDWFSSVSRWLIWDFSCRRWTRDSLRVWLSSWDLVNRSSISSWSLHGEDGERTTSETNSPFTLALWIEPVRSGSIHLIM